MTNDNLELLSPVDDPVFVVLDAGGAAMARRLKSKFSKAEIHGLQGRVAGSDQSFIHITKHLAKLFDAGRPIVGVMAAGIIIRALGSAAVDKRVEPPVLALAQDGSAVVPLLGGHNGANRLARYIASLTQGQAAITTAGDLAFGVALDDPPPGWHVVNPDAAKAIAAGLMAGEAVQLVHEAGSANWLRGLDFAEVAPKRIRLTDRLVTDPGDTLVLHPPVLALGLGCERGAEASELISLAEQSLAETGLSPQSIALVTSIDVKMDEAAIHDVAKHFGVPARFFDAKTLEAEKDRLENPSDVVFDEVGCHGVAEGAALAAVGPDGNLVQSKMKSLRATCAIARAANDLVPSNVGRARGRLTVVGNGPGAADWRSPQATRALCEATDVVGYQLYLDLVADLIEGKECHHSALSEEEARCRIALDLAASGKQVALVCSGDAGIYALASLTFELLDREDRADWNRVDLSVAPGISAFQAAGARMGAPFGHDFCTVSLSDLLTPWDVIEQRLKAAAEGDFIVAFYNPVSKRRRTQLAKAKEILLAHRKPDTPVTLARNLGRDKEAITMTTLEALSVDDVDMLTTVVVGNNQTRRIRRGHKDWVYTPRGYAAKMDADNNK